MTKFDIPKSIRLPGWPVKVKLVSQREIDEATGERNGADACFDYTDEGATILIRRTLPKREQRACLAHELQHALVDYLGVLLNTGKGRF